MGGQGPTRVGVENDHATDKATLVIPKTHTLRSADSSLQSSRKALNSFQDSPGSSCGLGSDPCPTPLLQQTGEWRILCEFSALGRKAREQLLLQLGMVMPFRKDLLLLME